MWQLAISLVCACLLANGCAESPPSADLPQSDYRVVEAWPKLPAGVKFGRVLSVAVHPDGRVFVSHDAGHASPNSEPIAEDTIFVLDPDSGELLSRLGAGLFRYPHSLTFDAEGRLWVTDSDANRIVRLDENGTIDRELGGSETCGAQ